MTEAATHKVTVVVTSNADDPDVHMDVQWEPLLSAEQVAEMGYIPAAYQFIETVLTTAVWMAQGQAEIETEDLSDERVIN